MNAGVNLTSSYHPRIFEEMKSGPKSHIFLCIDGDS